MRRKDKEVTSREWMEEVLREAEWFELAMTDQGGWPYVLPMNFGYEDGYVYVHGAREGKKVDVLRSNPKVCFQAVVGTEIIRDENDPSEFSMKYCSVTGLGEAQILSDRDEKRKALHVIMHHYDGPTEPMPDAMIGATLVVKIKVREMTGKVNGYAKPQKAGE